MFEFFGCVIAAVAAVAPVMKNLGEIAQGGRRLFDLASDILDRFGKKVPPAQRPVVLRQALSQAAAMPPQQFEQQLRQAVDAALPNQPEEQRKARHTLLRDRTSPRSSSVSTRPRSSACLNTRPRSSIR
jgi:hypothetical protein